MISFIIPWVRKDGFDRCVEAIKKHSNGITYELVAEEDVHRIGCNPMVNKLIAKSKCDVVCFMHDDSIPQPRFLLGAVGAMQRFPGGWGCVGFNDMIHDQAGPCTHWMIHKKMLRYFPDGVFYSEDYIHTRVDLELKEVSKSVGRYKWVEGAMVIHDNPIYNAEVKRDSVHFRGYSPESIKLDHETYSRRRKEQGAKWSSCTNRRGIKI